MEEDCNFSILPLLSVDDLFYGNCSHKKYCLCLNCFKRNSSLLSKQARHHLTYWHRIWCSASSRVCSDYLIGTDLNPNTQVTLDGIEELSSQLPTKSHEIINDLLEVSYILSKHDSSFSLTLSSSLDDADCNAWTD